ncbi:DUF2515 family protein [uncultured Phycicoccus sp.]|uniref:DUF2515 family protein n=1 Tax=uncultured Phycicoccus sp. TaxID=661422 RepID=UPI00261EB5C3|nr:hypothetical protein [uncultured Phycicoccus sp.]
MDRTLAGGAPDTVAGWRAAADALLSPPCCTFHRNMEISSRYAWLHSQQPTYFKWAAMAAIASHHVRLVLYPFRLDADRTGYVDLPRSLSRRRMLTDDANTMREVNNAIYDDIVWVHLAYLGAQDGIGTLRRLLGPYPERAPLLTAFEAIDRGRVVLADETATDAARRAAADLVWAGNLALLQHEQRAVVQPLFDRLSGTFARLISMGSTTTFEVRGLRQEVRYFTSFSLYSLTRGFSGAVRTRTVPRVTRFEDRWRWLETSVVPRFRRFDADPDLVGRTLRRVVEEAERYASQPCLEPT